jgi:flagellar assembly protein FliH
MTSSSDRKGAFPNVPPPSGGAKAASPYARFIPREELGSYAAWKPDSFGAPGQLERRAEPRPADGSLPTVEEWRAKIQAARQAGYQEGYRDGLAALEGFKQAHAAQLAARYGGLFEAFDAALAQHEQAIAQAVANASTLLTRRIVREELTTRPELVAAVAREAVDAVLMSARHIAVRVHPEDLAFVAQGAAEALQARGARLLADPTLTRGGCTIESDAGTIDATIENRWSRAAAGVGGEVPWEPQA